MRWIGLALAVGLAVSLALAPVTAESQQASKVYRVGFLHWQPHIGPAEDESYLPKSGAPSHSCLLSTPVDKPFDLTYLTQIVGMALQDKLA